MSSNYTLNRSQKKRCLLNIPNNSMKIMKLATLNQLITKSVGQSSNQYLGNLASLEVLNWKNANCNKIYNTSQASDRYEKAKVPITVVVPSRGNSTKRTQTNLRPGALGPGGQGVDIKHNSYARYLAKKKGKAILGKNNITNLKSSKFIVNNKFMKPQLIAGSINCIKK